MDEAEGDRSAVKVLAAQAWRPALDLQDPHKNQSKEEQVYNPSTGKVEIGGFLRFPGEPAYCNSRALHTASK